MIISSWYFDLVRIILSDGVLVDELIAGGELVDDSRTCLQRQIGVGTLVSSQDRRALAVLLMNRLITAGFVPPSGYMGFPLFVLAKGRSGQLSTILWRAKGTVSFWATRPDGVPFCPVPPRPAAPPCAAPTRTARGMFWFWTRQVLLSLLIASCSEICSSLAAGRRCCGAMRRRCPACEPQ